MGFDMVLDLILKNRYYINALMDINCNGIIEYCKCNYLGEWYELFEKNTRN